MLGIVPVVAEMISYAAIVAIGRYSFSYQHPGSQVFLLHGRMALRACNIKALSNFK